MHHHYLPSSMLALALAASPAAGQTGKNPLTLHYDRPATYFEESLLIGNGRLGAIIYGGTAEERISLNDITLWTGEPEGDPTTPDAYKHLPDIRAALDSEDYARADSLNRLLQGHYSQNYQPLGTLTLTACGQPLAADAAPTGYRRSLDLNRAVAEVNYEEGGVRCSREYFASAPDSVIVIRLRGEGGATFSRRITFHSLLPHQTSAYLLDAPAQRDRLRALEFKPATAATGRGEIEVDGYAAYSSMPNYFRGKQEKFSYDPRRGTQFRTLIRVIAADGKVSAPYNDVLEVSGCTEALIIIGNATSFDGPYRDPATSGRPYREEVQRQVEAASKLAFDSLLHRHLADYAPLFGRVSLDLGTTPASVASLTTDKQLWDYLDGITFNPDLEELYFQYGRYLLLASSRTEGVPANLQGLWNEYITPPWSANYTTNINVEENYWPAETANLSELHLRSMIGWIRQLPRSGEVSARNYYGVARGWNVGQNSDIWAMTNPVGLQEGDPCWASWTMGGAWLSTHLWEHYAFTMDEDYLRDVYPVLRGAADFCLGWLIEKEGYLMTSPGTSPENKFVAPDGSHVATLYGGTADLAMVRECLIDTREAAKVLGIDRAYCDTIGRTLARLLPYRIGAKGQLQEWYHDFDDEDPHHRHQSHLFGLYPGHHITLEGTPDIARACARTLVIKGDRTTGWSTGWRVNLEARLHDGEAAYRYLRKLLSYVSPDDYTGQDKLRGGGTYPNLLDAHQPFQIDGNFGGTAGIIEMLVQSSLEEGVTLLPALPKRWARQGELRGVRVRGGFELDFAWRNGQITSLEVRSLRRDRASLSIRQGASKWNVTLAPGASSKVKTL